MPGNKKVFVSHTHEDNERCIPLLSALDAWGVDYWFDTEQLAPGSQLSDRIQQGLAERDIFLRVCTSAAQQSFWMDRELASVRGMRVDARSRGLPDHRTIIFLILTPGYVVGPDEQADVVIDATGATRAETLRRLRDALGVPAPERRISRRAILGASVGGAVVVAGSAAAGSLYLTKDVVAAPPPVLPKGRLQPPTPQPAASRLKWFFKTAGGNLGDQNINGLEAGGGAIYVAADDGVYALAASDGAIRWFQSTLTTSNYDVPVLSGDTLYVGAESKLNYILAALNVADGSIRWTAQMADSINSTPAISSDLIFVRDSKALHALRADGSPLWQLPIPEGSLASNESTPVIAGGIVYVGGGDNAFYALDARSGAVLWRVPLKAPVLSSPAVANGVVYFGTSFGDAAIIALNIADGSQRWRVVDGDGSGAVDSSPVVAAGSVYIGSDQGVVYALDAATGKARWQVIPDKQNLDAVKTQPIVANGVVYVAIRAAVAEVTKLWALSAQDGSTLWQYSGIPASSLTSVSPVFGDGMVFFSGNGDHTVYALGV